MIRTWKTVSFLLLTIAWSWIFWTIGLSRLSHGNPVDDFVPFFFLGVYGPSICSVIITFLFDGLAGAKSLLKKIFTWKFPATVYLAIVLLPIIFVLAGIVLYRFYIGPTGALDWKTGFALMPMTLWTGIYAGPLGEELGWRGLLLPELQKKFSNLTSGLLIGVIWFIWHIPLFWAPFGTLASGSSFNVTSVAAYVITLTCISVIMTWIYNQSKGSVLAAILFHLSINAGLALGFFPDLIGDFRRVHLMSCLAMMVFIVYLISTRKLEGKALK